MPNHKPLTRAFLIQWPAVRNKFNLAVLTFLFWTALAAIFTTKTNLYYTFKGVSTSWIHLSIHHVAAAWTWLVITPVLGWFYKRFLATKKSLWQALALLTTALLVISTAHRFLTLLSDITFRKAMGYVEGSVWQMLWDIDSYFVAGLFDSAIAYLLIMFFFHVRQMKWFTREKPGAGAKPITHPESRLRIKHNGSYQWLARQEIIVLEAAGNYVRFVVKNQKPLLIRATLKSFEVQLPEDEFIRVNRSAILNTAHVKLMQPRYNGEYTIVLEGGKEIHTSRKYGQQWRSLL